MSMNQLQSKLDEAERHYHAAEKRLGDAMREFYAAQSEFHNTERMCLEEMVCKWCHGATCTCPKTTEPEKGVSAV